MPRSDLARIRRVPTTLWIFAGLVFACLPILLVGLGSHPLWDSDDARRALVAAEMLDRGDFLVPRLLGEPFPYYPPLAYWLIDLAALGARDGGVATVTPTVARLPSALSAIGLVLVVFWIGARTMDRRRGAVAALALLLLPGFSRMGRIVGPDMTLVLLQSVLVALYVEWELDRNAGRPPRRWLIPAVVVAGTLGVLAKGPVSLVFPMLAVLAHAAFTRQLRALIASPWLGAGFVVFAFALQWYVAVGVRESGAFLFKNLVGENLLAPAGQGMHVNGPFYYVPRFLVRGLPWTVLLLPVALADTSWRRNETRLAWLWFALLVVVLSASAAKRQAYLLFVMPPLALILGDAAVRIWEGRASESARRLLRLAAVVIGAFGLGAFALLVWWPAWLPPLAEPELPLRAVAAPLLLFLLVCLVGRRTPRSILVGAGLASWLALSLHSALLEQRLPTYVQRATEFCEELPERVSPDASLVGSGKIPASLHLCAGRTFAELPDSVPPPDGSYVLLSEDSEPVPGALRDRTRLAYARLRGDQFVALWGPKRTELGPERRPTHD